MRSSSRESIAIKGRLTRVSVALEDPEGDAPKARSHIKDLQRRAFERGVAVEREQWTKRVDAFLKGAEARLLAVETARTQDLARIEDFAVRLALYAAERITGAMVDAGHHNVKRLVEDALAEIGAAKTTARIEVRLHPDDHHQIVAGLAERGAPRVFERVTLMPDAAQKRGSFVVEDAETVFYASLAERLESMRVKLTDRAREAHA